MAIDRAPWNALVDDDGSNLVGSIWNKAAIKTVLLDPIEAMTANVVTVTATGTVHNLACGPASLVTVIKCDNAADLTITGFAFTTPARAGDLVYVQKRAETGLVYLANNDPGSTVKLLNLAATGPTPLSSSYGRATYVFEAGLWVLHHHEQGAWITPPFVAGNFLGLTLDPGDVKINRYALRGRTLHWTIDIDDGVTAAGTPLLIFPGGFLPANWTAQPAQVHDAGTWKTGTVAVTSAAPTYLTIRHNDYSGLAAGAVFLDFTFVVEVQ